MAKRTRRHSSNLPGMMTDLTLSSWATILRRTQLMAEGKCTAAEYHRMVTEKTDAARASFQALTAPGQLDLEAALRPWLVRAKANAKRLRRP